MERELRENKLPQNSILLRLGKSTTWAVATVFFVFCTTSTHIIFIWESKALAIFMLESKALALAIKPECYRNSLKNLRGFENLEGFAQTIFLNIPVFF